MSKYSKKQSTVIALWVLAMQSRAHPESPIPGGTAPKIITEIVNELGEEHSSDSILLHTHGYDRLFFGRKIGKSVTSIQKKIAAELKAQGIVKDAHAIQD